MHFCIRKLYRSLSVGLSASFMYEICALLGYYAASCGNCLPTFRDVSLPYFFPSWTYLPLEMVNNYHMTLRNIPEERDLINIAAEA